MNLNDKMLTYLWDLLEKQRTATDEILYAIDDGSKDRLRELYFELDKLTRHISHAIKESYDCETCYKAGLVSEEDATYYAKGLTPEEESDIEAQRFFQFNDEGE